MDVNIDDAKTFVNQFNISFTSVVDKEFITISYGVSKIPETFFIDKDGKIKNRVSGKLTSEKINALIKNMN
jgi:cytochrome oxidase Cu insertion factor (SCO1/SenC/PrrC family)